VSRYGFKTMRDHDRLQSDNSNLRRRINAGSLAKSLTFKLATAIFKYYAPTRSTFQCPLLRIDLSWSIVNFLSLIPSLGTASKR
jgi:hypothetical protein